MPAKRRLLDKDFNSRNSVKMMDAEPMLLKEKFFALMLLGVL